MFKRMLSMALVAALLVLCIPSALAATSTRYVYTENGGTLNVRSSPQTGKNVIGKLNFGAAVQLIHSYSYGWSEIVYGEDTAYVMTRFLVKNKPSSKPSRDPAGQSRSTDGAKAFAAINAEFKSAKKLSQPLTIVSRPARASGWVNLRWAPSTQAERIATCPQGKVLTAIAETTNWYQVEDPTTGMIGFIDKKFVTAQ